jgi:DNA-binding MarR family transcriptional regulator
MAAASTTTRSSLATGSEALFGLLYVQAHVIRAIDDTFDRAHGTGLSGYELMARLAHMHPDGASLRYLAEQVVVSPSRVSRLADELATRGWLERALSPHDGRQTLIRLTETGHTTLAAMEATLSEALQAHLLERLTQKQLDSLVAIGRTLGAPHC